MATVVFTGDPDHPDTDPPSVVAGGLAFALGEAVEVDDRTHAALLGKLRGNSHFHVTHMRLEAVRSMWPELAGQRPALPDAGADRGTPLQP
jgi:hypothetical protein